MKNLKISSRILKLLGIIVVALFIVLIILYLIQVRQEKLMHQESQAQFTNTVNSIIKLKTANLNQISYDYTYWDEFVEKIDTRDSIWLENNISTILKSFHVDYSCVYDTLKRMIQEASTSEFSMKKHITSELFRELHQKRFMNFFVATENDVMEVSCATVHHENDPTHAFTPPEGYLFIAKKWDKNYINDLEVLSNSKVHFERISLLDTDNPFVVSVKTSLPDWTGNTVAQIVFSKELKSLQQYHKQSLYLGILVAGSFLIILIAFFIETRRLVSNPLKLVTDILKSEDPEKIEKLSNSKGEFTMIGKLFLDFLDQKKQLIITKEKAEESDRLKSAFLANMSHEIRTPMNGILGFAELLKEPDLTGEEQQKFVSIIENSGQRMLNILNDLIDISKIEARQVTLHHVSTNINELLEYIFSFFKPEMENKGLEFFLHIKTGTQPVILITDKEKLYAILANLVKNAAKYTRRGFVELGFRLNNNMAEFYVKDSGIGIPKERQQAIFERFVQADIEDIQAMEGAGLGLTISKAYAEMMGGILQVDSEMGQGSTFRLIIPAKASTETTETTVSVDENKKSEVHLLRDLTILIAEDEETSDFYLTEILKDECKTILHTSSGIETVEMIRKNPDIRLVLMDIKMPVINGYEATRRIREFNKDIIIIAQTAYAQSGDREKAIMAGCNEYITKPVRKKALMEKLNQYSINTNPNTDE